MSRTANEAFLIGIGMMAGAAATLAWNQTGFRVSCALASGFALYAWFDNRRSGR